MLIARVFQLLHSTLLLLHFLELLQQLQIALSVVWNLRLHIALQYEWGEGRLAKL